MTPWRIASEHDWQRAQKIAARDNVSLPAVYDGLTALRLQIRYPYALGHYVHNFVRLARLQHIQLGDQLAAIGEMWRSYDP